MTIARQVKALPFGRERIGFCNELISEELDGVPDSLVVPLLTFDCEAGKIRSRTTSKLFRSSSFVIVVNRDHHQRRGNSPLFTSLQQSKNSRSLRLVAKQWTGDRDQTNPSEVLADDLSRLINARSRIGERLQRAASIVATDEPLLTDTRLDWALNHAQRVIGDYYWNALDEVQPTWLDRRFDNLANRLGIDVT